MFFFLHLVLLFVVSLRIDFGELLSYAEVSNERRAPPPNPVELAVRFKLLFFFFKIQNFRLCSMSLDLFGLKLNNYIKKDFINIW